MKQDNMPIHKFKKYEELGLTTEDFKQQNKNSKIIIENLKIFAKHGVLPEENIVGTYYLINAEIHTDLWIAAETDLLENTINYAEVNNIIHQEMAIPSRLLENVVGRIITKLELKFPQITAIKVKLTKTNPPMLGEMHGISIEMEKKR